MNITESPKFAARCKEYLIFLQNEMDGLRPNPDRSDFEGIRQFAHKTKGTSGAYKLDEISRKAGQVQETADTKDSQRLTEVFDELYSLVIEKLRRF